MDKEINKRLSDSSMSSSDILKCDWEDQTKKFSDLVNSFCEENNQSSLKLRQISKNMERIFVDFIESVAEDDFDEQEIDSESYFLPHISLVSLKTFVTGVTKMIPYLNETEKLIAEKLLFRISIRQGFLKESCELLSKIYLNLEDCVGSKHGYGVIKNLYSTTRNDKNDEESHEYLPFCNKVFLSNFISNIMEEIETLAQINKEKKIIKNKLEILQEYLFEYIIASISCFNYINKEEIDEDKEFWDLDVYSKIILCQKTTISWIIDYFIRIVASSNQNK